LAGRIRLERAYTTPAELENRILLTKGERTSETVVPATDHFRLMLENICTIIQNGSDFSFLNRQAATIAKLADQMQKGCMEPIYAA
jgi:NDP-hexose-3-ketoreductase